MDSGDQSGARASGGEMTGDVGAMAVSVENVDVVSLEELAKLANIPPAEDLIEIDDVGPNAEVCELVDERIVRFTRVDEQANV